MQALIIIAKSGFQDVELQGTRNGLLDGGFEIVLASTEAGPCTGKFGSTEHATIAMKDAKVEDYDRIAFIGGPGAVALADDTDALALARAFVAAKELLGAICIAPTILAKAGILKGKKATVWDDGESTQINLLKHHGATYIDEAVVVDGLIVTGNGPAAAGEFGRVLAAM